MAAKQKHKQFDKSFKLRCDDQWLEHLAFLAKETNRTQAQFIRDFVFWLRFSSAGMYTSAFFTNEQVTYRPMQPTQKVVKSWEEVEVIEG